MSDIERELNLSTAADTDWEQARWHSDRIIEIHKSFAETLAKINDPQVTAALLLLIELIEVQRASCGLEFQKHLDIVTHTGMDT